MGAEEQRKASRHNVALSASSLAEYQALKSTASTKAVDERQALESLSREEKTANRTLSQLTERHATFEEKKTVKSEELRVQTEKRVEMEAKTKDLMNELQRAKQELDNMQSERARIAYVILFQNIWRH